MDPKELNVVVAGCFNSAQGQKVLEYLKRQHLDDPIDTLDPVEMSRRLGRRDVVLDLVNRSEEVNK